MKALPATANVAQLTSYVKALEARLGRFELVASMGCPFKIVGDKVFVAKKVPKRFIIDHHDAIRPKYEVDWEGNYVFEELK